MASKKSHNNSDEDEDYAEAAYIQEEEDDDDDDEVDFVPDDDGEDEEEDEIETIHGSLCCKEKHLIFEGDSVHLRSQQPVEYWNPKHPTQNDDSKTNDILVDARMRTFHMTGSLLDVPSSKFALTLTAQRQDSQPSKTEDSKLPANDSKLPANDDSKMGAAKISAGETIVYGVYGREEAQETKDRNIEFQGRLGEVQDDGHGVSLTCQVKRVVSMPAAKPSAAAAASTCKNNDDDDDDDDEADEAFGYDELIALHQDAGVSVEALRKRYREEATDGDQKPSAVSQYKRQKSEEDEDYGF